MFTIYCSGPQCPDLLAVTIGTYLSDTKWRQPFANATVASIILSLIDSNPPVSYLSLLLVFVLGVNFSDLTFPVGDRSV